MSPDEVRALMLPVHGVVGVAALVGGFGALAAEKGTPAHRWLGRVFVAGMAGAVLAAVPVLVVTKNLFLTGMGAFAAYMTWTGWRIARQRDAAGGALDQGVSVAMMVAGAAFAAFGALVIARGHGLGVVALAMGAGSAVFARQHWRWFRAARASRAPWVAEHLGAVGGGLIAGITAFLAAAGTNYLPGIPEPVLWLGPTVVLGPLLTRASRRFVARA